MNAFSEVFPMIAGVLTGLVCATMTGGRGRIGLWAVLTILFGALATYVSGEYRESWAFVLLDMLWVGGISYGIILAFNLYRRRSRN